VASRAVIVGATSAVGEALAASYARDGWALTVVARDPAALASVASNLRLRYGCDVLELHFDAGDPATAEAAGRACLAAGAPDVVIYAVGCNAADGAVEDPTEIALVHSVNFGSAAAFTAPLLRHLGGRRDAALAFISSVAGDRGRKANFIYGSAKAALNAYAQGLRALLHPAGVSVTTVKLGYVDSRMSFGLAPLALTISAERAARCIRTAVERRREVVYVPGFWRAIMTVIRAIPEGIFKRLPLP